MLDQNIKTQLQSHFAAITDPIELVLALDDSNKSNELNSLANDLSSLSTHITVSEQSDATRAPNMSVRSPKRNTHIDFAGIPMGHEFSSLVLALLQTGGHPS